MTPMAVKLVCTLPFHSYVKGQEVTDPHLVEALLAARDAHFVRVETPDTAPPAAPAPAVDHAAD